MIHHLISLRPRKASKEVEEAMVATNSPPKPAGLSPTKQMNLHTQCFEQLEKLHDLMQRKAFQKSNMKSSRQTSSQRSKSINNKIDKIMGQQHNNTCKGTC